MANDKKQKDAMRAAIDKPKKQEKKKNGAKDGVIASTLKGGSTTGYPRG